MRILASKIGDKTGKRTVAELQHVGRRNVVRHHDHLRTAAIAAAEIGKRRRGACQYLQHALADLLNIRFALAQIGILDFVELRR